MITINLFIILGIILPILLLPGVLFLSGNKRLFLLFSFIGALLFLSYYNLTAAELGSTVLLTEEGLLAPFYFNEHPYSRFAALGFTLAGAFALLYGGQLSKPTEQALSLLALAGVTGIVFAGNFITLFLFWEVLTFSTAGIIFCKGTPHARSMGARFLFFHLIGGFIVLVGILQHYAATGSFDLGEPGAGLFFFVIGVGFKAAFLPFHLWVAWGYPSASFPSSVLLAGLTTKIGVYALARIIPPHEAIVLMGGMMAIVGVICALLQHNLRRLLSYHIISQVGYMVAGVGLGLSLSIDGGLLHMVNNMFYKGLLFMSAGAVLYATGTEDVHELTHHEAEDEKSQNEYYEEEKKALWKALPVATIGAVVGALAIAGVPLFSGYVSKYMLKQAMYGAGPAEWMLIIASIGTTASFCKFVYFGFLKARAPIRHKQPLTMQVSILIVSVTCILLGVYPQVISNLLPYHSSLAVYSASGVWETMQLIIVGVLVFINLARPLRKGIHVPAWMSIENVIFIPLANKAYEYLSRMRTPESELKNYNTGKFSKRTPHLEGAASSSREEHAGEAFQENASTTGGSKESTSSRWTIRNISFDQLLIISLLGMVIFVFLYFSWTRGTF